MVIFLKWRYILSPRWCEISVSPDANCDFEVSVPHPTFQEVEGQSKTGKDAGRDADVEWVAGWWLVLRWYAAAFPITMLLHISIMWDELLSFCSVWLLSQPLQALGIAGIFFIPWQAIASCYKRKFSFSLHWWQLWQLRASSGADFKVYSCVFEHRRATEANA